VPITPTTLAGLRSLDDLIELASELRYQPRCEELGPVARARLGLHGVTRAAIIGAYRQL